MTGDIALDLPRLLALLRARWRLIAAIVLGAMALAAVLSLAQSDKYTASADLLFGRPTNADAISVGGTTDTGELPERAAATNLALASLDTVAVRVARTFSGVTAAELKDAVSIEAAGESDLVTVTAEWGSPNQAAAVANAFAAEIASFRRDTARADIQRAIDALEATLATRQGESGTGAAASEAAREVRDRLLQLEALKALQSGNVQVVETATPPEHRSSPTPLRNAVLAAVAALLIAVFLVVLMSRFSDRVDDEEELSELMGTSVLTRIPYCPGDARESSQEPAFAEAFEFLRLNLELIGHEGDSVVVAVTSPTAGEGKTTVVAWLASSLAASGAEVTALDLDLRKPELHTYFDVPLDGQNGALEALLESVHNGDGAAEARYEAAEPEPLGEDRPAPGRRAYSEEDITTGLAELARSRGHARRAARALKDSGRNIPESTLRRWKDVHADLYAEIRAARRRGTVAAPRLRLLAGRNHLPVPAGLIARSRLHQLFSDLRQEADHVLVDTVPVSTVADATAVAAAADGVILVVDLERSRRRDLLTAKKQLANARARVFGIVLNNADVGGAPYTAQEEDGRVPEHAMTAP
jgi:Mrp family chromosome partitioning ATPase/capsular polysaccharide biosynthesis protein